MFASFWGSPDIWTCRGCPDGAPVDDNGFCEECRDVYRREYEEHLDNLDKKVVPKHELRCNTCNESVTYDHASHGTCKRCIKAVYKPANQWCDEHGAHFGRCPACGDQFTLNV